MRGTLAPVGRRPWGRRRGWGFRTLHPLHAENRVTGVTFISFLLLLVSSVIIQLSGAVFEITEDYCTSEKFIARCPSEDQVIFIARATYGRLRAGRCITSEYAHAMGCFSDVTPFMDDRCSGRNACWLQVAAIDAIAQPCAKDFKSFLDVTYRCEPDCRHGNRTLLSGKQSDYLALYPRRQDHLPYHPLTLYSYPVQFPCPWLITVDPGRHITFAWRVVPISIEDLGVMAGEEGEKGEEVHLHVGPTGSRPASLDTGVQGSCPFTLTFKENSLSGESSSADGYVVRSCELTRRRPVEESRLLFMSRGNRVEVSVISSTFYAAEGGGSGGGERAGKGEDGREGRGGTGAPGVRGRAGEGKVGGGEVEKERKGREEDEEITTGGEMAWRPYVLQYQVHGCSDAELPTDVMTSRSGDDVAILCNESQEIFYVTCLGDKWVGEIGNCSNTAARATGSDSVVRHPAISDFRRGVVTAVIVGVVLGFIVGAFMLVVIYILRRNRSFLINPAIIRSSCPHHQLTDSSTQTWRHMSNHDHGRQVSHHDNGRHTSNHDVITLHRDANADGRLHASDYDVMVESSIEPPSTFTAASYYDSELQAFLESTHRVTPLPGLHATSLIPAPLPPPPPPASRHNCIECLRSALKGRVEGVEEIQAPKATKLVTDPQDLVEIIYSECRTRPVFS